jgi:hypothetical protein
MAKRLLAAQAVLITGIAVGIAVKEFPGLVREIRIWRMAGRRAMNRA